MRPGESEASGEFKRLVAEGNRLQDVFMAEFRRGLTGNELLRNILVRAGEEGIPNPRVYSHSLGYYLHESGPLVGLPWERVCVHHGTLCGGRGAWFGRRTVPLRPGAGLGLHERGVQNPGW